MQLIVLSWWHSGSQLIAIRVQNDSQCNYNDNNNVNYDNNDDDDNDNGLQ